MISELSTANKVVGAKQVRRALNDGRAKKLFIAVDADPRVLKDLVQDAVRKGIRLEQVDSMRDLGEACGIAVGSAVAALL